jgi:hypothetical protein
VFIGSDFHDIKPYKEFEVSPPNEWVDLDINLSAGMKTDGCGTPDLSTQPASTGRGTSGRQR